MSDMAMVICDACRIAEFVPKTEVAVWETNHIHEGGKE